MLIACSASSRSNSRSTSKHRVVAERDQAVVCSAPSTPATWATRRARRGPGGGRARCEAEAACSRLPRRDALQKIDLEFDLDEAEHAINIRALVKTDGPTGVEMEALTAVSVAALTVYDMCKKASREIRISDIELLAKTGGQSGDYRRSL